ncbi:phosphoribosylformylglycinamidine synthase subunit PurL [Mechercharimyces sp. CAU 1602]|uniref:phosphoribosylformylglycinamidine synthase subunit PurL n=1 Tax=Mechercharimyces sp. CAU 1602 TaxID=2973933 RepID=UPI002162D498|nr:phosphoribosylformylglycinamidine synthase subunit PurL [Mechercharimyces sp. CAU 1602]MCS1352017.1 phosphoribosylformylglycinamidine synthase subunit PurL [Mechercharimyces sp. CAU 1602]
MNQIPSAEEIRIHRLYRELGLTDDEYQLVIGHMDRLPNWTEISVYSVMWSEHCSYKNSKPLLRRFPTTGPHILQGPGEGAGVIDIGDGEAVVFKIESHNHPSAIEPFQGAATGVGGIIRDVFSMGARPVALLNALRFGTIDQSRVRYLFENVVAGIAHYGNVMGIPTVGGETVFDGRYEENPLVNAMCVGVLQHGDLQKGIAVGEGNPVIYVGASTGRDGIHGATFASEELSDASQEKRPAVQVGDPFMEKLLLEACLELVEAGVLLGIQDMGAAGLTCSSAEMAAKGGTGLELNLDAVPQRETGMLPYEILLSESQERMLLVVEKGQEEQVEQVFSKWGLSSAVIGRVSGDGRYRIFHQGEVVADIPVTTLVDDAPVYERDETKLAPYPVQKENTWASELFLTPPEVALKNLLSSPNIASKGWVYRQYDHTVRASTAVKPGSDAAVIHLRGSNKALAMSTDGNGRYVYLDPVQGGAIAVAEAARNVVCAGARPLGVTDCLNFGNPEKDMIYQQLSLAITGMSDACRVLQTPVIGGNVSLYNESKGHAIYPTPIVGMVGLIENVQHVTTLAFKEEGELVFLLGETLDELGGSEWQQLVQGEVSGRPPHIDLDNERRLQETVYTAITAGWITAAHDLAEGGLAVALAECCMAGGYGVHVKIKSPLRPNSLLFSESQSRVLVSIPQEYKEKLEQLALTQGVPLACLGEVTQDNLQIEVNEQEVIHVKVSELTHIWEGAIPCAMNSSSTS